MKHNIDRDKAVVAPDSGSENQHERHLALADEIQALAIALRTFPRQDGVSIRTEKSLLERASNLYSARRKVDEIFGVSGFSASPGWDMMLDLYRARLEGKQVSVTSACIGAACPATTGLRWLQLLENPALIERTADHIDRRRILVELTEQAKLKVEAALSEYA